MEHFGLRGSRTGAIITPQDVSAVWATNSKLIPDVTPVRYWRRSDALPGDIVGDEYNGLLISPRVEKELRRLAGDAIATVPAVIQDPSGIIWPDYALLRVRCVVRLEELSGLATTPVAAVRTGVDYIVVSAPIRERLESLGVDPEHFPELIFAA